eukprot:1615098-Rhodomonas_salina.1
MVQSEAGGALLRRVGKEPGDLVQPATPTPRNRKRANAFLVQGVRRLSVLVFDLAVRPRTTGYPPTRFLHPEIQHKKPQFQYNLYQECVLSWGRVLAGLAGLHRGSRRPPPLHRRPQ